jgi:hypothetical protein
MVLYIESYASNAVGDNLSNGKVWAKSNRNRKVVRMCLCGGAAALDAEVDVFYGSEQVAHLINYFTGGPDKLKMLWHTTNLFVAKNTPISVPVTNAFTSTATFLVLDIKNV